MSEPYRYAFAGEGPADVTVPVSVRVRHMRHYDPETDALLDIVKEAPGATILEVGAHDNPVSLMLAGQGLHVTSVDLRPYDFSVAGNHSHYVGDFTNMPDEFYKQHIGYFDSVISISALEHFGLSTYGESNTILADVSACRIVHMLLKKGGCFYVLVPFGGKMVEKPGHWRVYDMTALRERIIQDFAVEQFRLAVCEDCTIGGVDYKVGMLPDLVSCLLNSVGIPSVGAVLQLRKVK